MLYFYLFLTLQYDLIVKNLVSRYHAALIGKFVLSMSHAECTTLLDEYKYESIFHLLLNL
jgi:hypothetical protein